MVACKFWLKGYCREGDNCRFEHPARVDNVPQNRNQGPHKGQPRNNDQNRFATLGGHNVDYQNQRGGPRNQNRGGGNVGRGGGHSNQSLPRDAQRYELDPQRIAEDLGPEKPQWIMSAYGPGADPPVQLFGGFPLEQSPEEIRVLHYLNMASGNPQQSAQQEQELANQANQHAQTTLSDPVGAVRYILDGLKTHPNRRDRCGPRTTSGEFSREYRKRQLKNANRQQQGFSSIGAQPSGFGQTLQSQGAFGQNSGFLSQMSNIGTVQPIGMTGNTFTGPSTQVQAPPGHLGTGNPQPAASNNVSGFGGQQNTAQSAFAVNNTMQSGFGSGHLVQNEPLPQPNSTQAHGPGEFGMQAPAASNANGFGQNGQMNGASSNNMSLNGMQPLNQGSTGFGGDSQTPQFGNQAADNSMNSFLNKNQQPDNFGSSRSLVSQNGHDTRRDSTGKLLTWKGKPVEYIDGRPCYRMQNGFLQRIFFPNGAPDISSSNWPNETNNGKNDSPTDNLESAYKFVRDTGKFKDGFMPENPPYPEMCRWDI